MYFVVKSEFVFRREPSAKVGEKVEKGRTMNKTSAQHGKLQDAY